MPKILKRLCLIIVVALLIFSAGCSSNTNKDNSSNISKSDVKTEQKAFDKFANDLFVNEVQTNTINLHYTLAHPEKYDIEDYPITLGDYSVEAFKQSNSDIQDTLNQLADFNYNILNKEQQLLYDVLYDYLVTENDSSDLYLYNEPLSPTLGEQAQLPVLYAEYAFNTKVDVDNYLNLLSQVEPYFAKIIEFEKQKSDAGLFMSDDMASAIISQCQKFIENPEQNYLIDIFNEKIDSLNALTSEEKTKYKDDNSKIVTNTVIPSYTYLINELTNLKGKGTNSGGLCNFESGKKYYEYLIKRNIGTAKTVDELTTITDSQIKADLKKMSTLMIDNPDLIEQLNTYTFSETTPDDIIKTLVKNIKNDFPDAPDVNYTFKYVHESLEDNLSPAFYLIPPIDDYNNNVIYINGSDKYSSQDLFTTIAHEGYPGHMYQTTYFDSLNSYPVRNILNYTGYVEGWATYTEIYSYSISGLDKNLADFLALNTSYALGIYSRIDIGVNYNGWQLQDVASYLSNFGIKDTDITKEIFDNMVECPGNYLNYYIGYLEISELKEIASESLGNKFNLKDFHKFVLDMGPAPFNVILNYLNTWIEEER